MSDDRKSSRDDLKVTTPHTQNPVRNTGSQRAIEPNAPRASNPQMRRPSSGQIPAVPPRNTGSQRAIDPNAPRASNPGMRAPSGSQIPAAPPRASNPQMRRMSSPAIPQADAGEGPTASGVALPGADAPTNPKSAADGPTSPGLKNPRVSGTHKAMQPPPKKKGGAGKVIAFAVAVMLLFGVGVVWVVLHPELFPGARVAAGDVGQPPVKPPLLKAPPREPPVEAAADTAAPKEAPKAEEPKPAEPPAEEAKADSDEVARPEPGKPGRPAPKHRGKTVAKAEPAEPAPAPVEKPKEEAPPPTAAQLTEKTAQIEALMTKNESIRGPDPVMRGFLTNVKAETAAADTDDKKRQAWAHLSQLQARLSK